MNTRNLLLTQRQQSRTIRVSSLRAFVTQGDVERIAHATLRELGIPGAAVTVSSGTRPGEFRVDIQGGRRPVSVRVRCGPGSTAQWVHQQIFDQYTAQS